MSDIQTGTRRTTREEIASKGKRLPGLPGGAQAYADAEEQGDKNTEISDSDKKMSALMDMIADACSKMDEGSRRQDARMDAMEDNFKRMDSDRRDSAKKDEDDKDDEKKEAKSDARKDEDKDEKEDKEEVKEAAKADEDDDKDEKKEEKRDDARKDAKRKDDDTMADHAPVSRAEYAALRADLAKMQARAPQILADADRERLASIQEQADPAFQAFGDRAPGPLDGETPKQYKLRLGAKMQAHSPKWKGTRLSATSDETMLDNILADVFADSIAAARRGVDVPTGTLRELKRQSGGHTYVTFEGDTGAWMNPLAGHSQRAIGAWHKPH